SPELQLKSVSRLQTLRRGHNAGIVDENIERPPLSKFLLRKIPHRAQRGKVKNPQFHMRAGRISMQAGESVFTPSPVTAGEHYLGTLAGQLQRCMVNDAAVRAGDDDPL